MIPLALRITNFRSFKGVQTFNFPQKPGLYFMQGVNAAEPRLEANGAGKSSIWDALTWCWFDKTPRGLRAGDVCNWDAGKGAEVAFIFMRAGDGAVCCVKRTWSPNTWTLDVDGTLTDLTKEKDNPALTWLSLSFESFLNSVLTAQSQPMFLDMKRDAQAALFSEVMSLDHWLEYSTRASKSASDTDRKVRVAERDLARLEGELAALGKHDWRVDSDEWERKRKARRLEIVELYESKMARRKDLKAKCVAAEVRCAEARNDLRDARPDEVARVAEMVEVFDKHEHALDLKLVREQTAYDALKEHIADLSAKSTCPVCGQSMTADHRRKELERAKRQRDVLEVEIDKLEASMRAAREAGAQASKGHKELKAKVDAARDAIDVAQRELGECNRAFDINERDLDALEDDADRVAEEVNPYADAEERERTARRKLTADFDDAQRELDELTARQSLFSFWVRGFKELRLSLIAEALTELEVEVNSCVDALGLLGWEMQFQMDREGKGGSVQRGFNCFVQSPHNASAVPWSAWSGGESQRLRLAGTMGLADLIRSRTGTQLALEVWDEPTEGLSAQGIRDLLEALSVRASREQRVIFVVDHRAHDFGGFAGSVTVTKRDGGSIIESSYN